MTTTSPSTAKTFQLNSPDGALAVIAPELGGWLLRYARPTKHGLVDALHFSQPIADRYPKCSAERDRSSHPATPPALLHARSARRQPRALQCISAG